MVIAVIFFILTMASACSCVLLAHRFAIADGLGEGEPKVLKRLGCGISASIGTAVFFAFICVIYIPLPF